MVVAIIIAVTELIVVGTITALFIWYFSSETRSIIAGAPYSPMPKDRIASLMDMARLTPSDTLLDLGCGDGRIMNAALKRGVGATVGYDVAWWPLFLARRKLRHWGARATLIREDARTADIADATIVYMYLFPKIVNILAPHLAASLRPGARVLCAAFPIDIEKHPEFRLLETRKIVTFTAYLFERV